MTQLNPTKTRLSDDDRYELATVAQIHERANSPKHLVVLGLFVVLVSLVILIFAWRIKAGAIENNRRKADELTRIHELIANIETLENAQNVNPLQDENQPIPDILSQFKRYATQAKIERDIGLPSNNNKTSRVQPMLNSTKIIYPYSVRDPSLASLLDWVQISTEQIPGLGVQEITIKPEAKNWFLKVTFVRYERNE